MQVTSESTHEHKNTKSVALHSLPLAPPRRRSPAPLLPSALASHRRGPSAAADRDMLVARHMACASITCRSFDRQCSDGQRFDSSPAPASHAAQAFRTNTRVHRKRVRVWRCAFARFNSAARSCRSSSRSAPYCASSSCSCFISASRCCSRCCSCSSLSFAARSASWSRNSSRCNSGTAEVRDRDPDVQCHTSRVAQSSSVAYAPQKRARPEYCTDHRN